MTKPTIVLTAAVLGFTSVASAQNEVLLEYFDTGNAQPPLFGGTPTSTATNSLFETATNRSDNYGSRTTSFFIPALTANYTFAAAADDDMKFFLSTNADPANAVQIISNDGWSASRNYTTHDGGAGGVAANFSAPISLVAGQTYFIGGTQQDGGGGDNYAVTATTDPVNDPIFNGRAPLGDPSLAATIGTLSSVPEPATATFAALALGGLLLGRRSRKA